jgi:ABC-2 type transport system permease protein
MSLQGVHSVVMVETAKLLAQIKVQLLLLSCVVAPLGFAIAMRVQSSLPTDTIFGRAVGDSGPAVPLVVLGFAALWAFPVLTSIVGGDVFAAEDRYGTWSTLLTRSRTRGEIFAGKVVTALAFSILAVAALAISSIAAGALVIGFTPLVDLSGVLLAPRDAFNRVSVSWLSILPPAFGFTALAVLLSVVTRSSAAGIGLPVVIGLGMQLLAFIDGPELARQVLISSAFGAWHGLLVTPAFHGPLIYGAVVSTVYFVACLTAAHRLLMRRDIGR